MSRLTVLLLHLLKWQFQPGRRGSIWDATITLQRDDIADHLRDNPSLEAKIGAAITDAYRKAAILVTGETGVARSTFPANCPWSFDQIMSADFWPGEASH